MCSLSLLFLISLPLHFLVIHLRVALCLTGRRQSNHSATYEASKSPMKNHRGETTANRDSINAAQPETEDRTPAPLHRSDNSIRSSLDWNGYIREKKNKSITSQRRNWRNEYITSLLGLHYMFELITFNKKKRTKKQKFCVYKLFFSFEYHRPTFFSFSFSLSKNK